MKTYDISVPFSTNLPFYPSDPELTIETARSIAAGDSVNVHLLTFGSHTGTHLDAPKHFLDDGKTLSDLPADAFLGDAVVAEAMGKPAVLREDVEKIPGSIRDKFVLFKTDNGDAMLDSTFRTDFVYLDPGAAEALVERGAKGVAVDYLSVDKYKSPGKKSHYTLLGAGMIIIEGTILTGVPEGEYFLSALPLNIPQGNGCPVRAVLIQF